MPPPPPHPAPLNCAQEGVVRPALTLSSPAPTTLAPTCLPKALLSLSWWVGMGVGWRREGWMVTKVSKHNAVLREASSPSGEADRAQYRRLWVQGTGPAPGTRQTVRGGLPRPLGEGR